MLCFATLPRAHTRTHIFINTIYLHTPGLNIRRKKLGPDHLKTASAHRSLGIILFESGQYDESLENLETFVRIRDANKMKNTVDYVLAHQLIGDIQRYYSKADLASSAFMSAFNAYNHSKDVSTKYPGFAPILQKRVEEDTSAPPPTSFFARITGEIGRLSDETKAGGPALNCEPEEIELRGSIMFDD